MSNFNYFQRYSQKENVVTNNVLLLFSWFKKYMPEEFYNIIIELTDVDSTEFIGNVQFINQYSHKQKGYEVSVPDGVIMQNNFKIIVETKLKSKDFNLIQLERHCNKFRNEDLKILLAISSNEIEQVKHKEIKELINKINKENKKILNNSIVFVHRTFNDISDIIRSKIMNYHIDMNDIIDDFDSFCYEEGLISNTRMRAINATTSFNDNVELNIYYCPENRKYYYTEFLGLSQNMSIERVGKVIKMFKVYNLDTDNPTIDYIFGENITNDEMLRIKEAARRALNYETSWNIMNNHIFYILDNFIETDFAKKTKYKFQKSKIFEFEDYINQEDLNKYKAKKVKNLDTESIAEILKYKTWD